MSSPHSEDGLLQPQQRLRLYQELEKILKTYIIRAKLMPGDRLPPERELAKRLGASRATIRQAVILLEVQGIVEVRQGDGIRLVGSVGAFDDAESLRELVRIRQRFPEVVVARETLECKMAELAARNHTNEDMDAIDAALIHMGQEIEAGGVGLAGNTEFHEAVHAAAHNSVLRWLLQELKQPIFETQEASLNEPGRPPASLVQHRKIAEAIRQANSRAAASTMRSHIRLAAKVRLLQLKP